MHWRHASHHYLGLFRDFDFANIVSMNQESILLIGVIVAGFAFLAWLIANKFNQPKDTQAQDTLLEWLKATQGDIKSLQSSLTKTLQQSDKNVTDTLQKSYQDLNARLDNAAKVIGELKEETGKFSEIGRSMKDLQDFLKSPKLRGNIGEKVLKDLIAQMLPHQAYTMQHRFQSGDIVDAAINTRAGIICIDSKFPMENFTKMNQVETKSEETIFRRNFVNDVRKHIRDIATKYIRTDENTLDFALMYIPSESVYYEIMTQSPELYDYAQENRILPVSPTTFYAFLQTVLVSFEGQRIAAEAKEILKNLRDIQKSSLDFSEKLSILSRHITNAHNNMTTISTDFNRLQVKIDNTSQITLGSGDDTPQLADE
jgi:DNA recombination protein RmuC